MSEDVNISFNGGRRIVMGSKTIVVKPVTDSERNKLQQRLSSVMEKNLTAFYARLLAMEKEEIINRAPEIAAMQETCLYMKESFHYQAGELEALLKLDDPLTYIAEYWPMPVSELFDVAADIHEAISELNDMEIAQSVDVRKKNGVASKQQREKLHIIRIRGKGGSFNGKNRLKKGGDAR